MPYHAAKSDQCPTSKPWACIKTDTGEVMGCHETKEAAQAQVEALYAAEGDAMSLAEAGARRAAAVRSQGKPAGAPAGAARLQPFRAQLRAQLVDHDGQQRYQLDGYATVFDQPYVMWDLFGPYNEVVAAGAADETLAASPDVAFLVNHRGVTMARTTNGTLGLEADALGLRARALVNPKRQDVRDLVVAIDDRDITEMSFAFWITAGGWNDDYTEYRIEAFDLHRGDVSAVNYGANPYTSIAARAREILADLDHLPAGAVRAAMARLARRADIPDLARSQAGRAAQSSPAPTPASPPAQPAAQGRSVAMLRALLATQDDDE